MDLEAIDRVAVLGAGTMGHGIAEVVAMAGYPVTVRDVDADAVEEGYERIEWSLGKLAEEDRLAESPGAVLDRIDATTDLAAAVDGADLVVEAVPERMALKREVFAELDEHAREEAILASNTSSLSITEIASATDRPERVVGLHFFVPPVRMELVEVVHGEETAEDVAETAHAFVEAIDRTPIRVRKDVEGFVVNSVLGPYVTEAAWMVSDGEATVRAVDATMVHERGYSMGPFELADLTGIDVGYHVREEAGRPIPPVLEAKVEAGEYGRKTGRGYYDYEDGDGADYGPGDASEDVDWLRIEARMIDEAAELVGDDVATPEEVDAGLRLGAGFPDGPCRRADELGLDRVLAKLWTLHAETGEDRFEPADELVERVGAAVTGGRFYADDGDDVGTYRLLNYDLDEAGVLAVELDRPERLNALSADLLDEIEDLLASVDVDAVRCVTIEGAGDRAFSAGADVEGFGGVEPTDAMDVTPAFETVDDFERPTVAKIDGYCLGAGLELALACDLRIATADSEFGAPEIGLGLIPGGGGTQRLLRLLGETRAKELVFRGNRIDANRAEDWGLINRAVPGDAFEDAVDEFVDDLVTGPPVALAVAKTVMNEGADASLPAGLALESQGFGLLFSTEDAVEGTTAFVEDRDPEFDGR